jgi:AraC-like DNA-binding protein
MMDDENFQLRRRSFISFYVLLAVHVCSSYDIITHKGAEVLATFPICTLCVAFTTFMMLSSAYFGRKHHHSFSLWFVLMQYPAIMLVIHIITRLSGRYIRIHSMDDIFYDRQGAMHIIFVGRLAFLAVVVVCFIFMIVLLIDAYGYYKKQQRIGNVTESTRLRFMRRDEILNIIIYAVLLIAMMLTYLIPQVLPHIIVNVLMTVMIGRTLYVYNNFLRYSETETRKAAIYAYITKKIAFLADQERSNPIYQNNPTMDEVADALNVDHQDFKDYLYEELQTNFSGWLSEQKMQHITSQLVRTDRRIGELAKVCGYINATSLSRAFKTKYGQSPSEYREANKNL